MSEFESKKPLVSIIMGAYNAGTTLREAMDSVLAQTFRDWEFVICDDGSTDATLAIVEEYARRDARIIVLRNHVNRGLAPTLNTCLVNSRGPLIARMDADDTCRPDRLERQVEFLTEHPETSVVSTAMSLFDQEDVWGVTSPVADPTPTNLLRGSPFAHAAAMIRRKALVEVNGYDEGDRCRRVEDFDLWLRLYAVGHRGSNLAEPLYSMRNDRAAVGRRTWSARLNEAAVLARVVREFRFPVYQYVRVARPLMLAALPTRVYRALYRRRHRASVRNNPIGATSTPDHVEDNRRAQELRDDA